MKGLIRLGARNLSALAIAGALSAPAYAAPQRVVSMNLCTDQLAMRIAAPGQLHSVSYLAADPISSAMVAEAGAYALNHGQAEEIFLMRPDLVLAGTYSTRATVDLLKRLGVPVEQFDPESSFDDVRANVTRMGELLGQPERAAALVAEIDRNLAAAKQTPHPELVIATWFANSYTSGAGTLVDAVIKESGLTNLADRLGYGGLTRMPLELLVLAQPDMIAEGDREYSSPALAQQGFEHPAFRALKETATAVETPSRYTICGGPFTAEAVRLLSEAASRRGGQ